MESFGSPYKTSINDLSDRSAYALTSSVALVFLGKIDLKFESFACALSHASQSCSNIRNLYNSLGVKNLTAIMAAMVVKK